VPKLTPRRAFVVTLAAMVAIVIGLLSSLNRFQPSALEETLLVSLALILLVLPLLCYALVRPVREQTQQRTVAEQALREAAAWQRGILDTLFDGVLITDEQGRIEQVNPAAARIFGYSGDELVGRPLAMLIPADRRDLHARHLAAFVQGGEVRIMARDREVRGLRKDGSQFPVEIAITELWSGGRRHFVGVLRDVTAHKQAEAALQQAHDELEQGVRRGRRNSPASMPPCNTRSRNARACRRNSSAWPPPTP
jgi:PAS domain S-box-containing protein